ncbi:MAG: ATP-dependent RecD-like DNA helicase [Dysosmobacter sp.]|nr:ATP-dependent RecD-like DNA helicase [Dysosmobacter sp.]
MEELTTREGTVQSVIFQNEENGYTVLRLVTEEGELITVVGCVPCAAPGEHLGVSGAWETHPQHGTQLRAEEVERRLPEDAEELISYLGSGICKGLGPATARRLVERFGAETADVISSQPEKLSLIKGITARRAMEISESFRRHMGLRRLMAFLAQYGLPPVLAIRLRQIYGDGALDAIRRDPYLLSADAGGLPFSAADEIAMSMGFSARSPERLRSALLFELSHNEGNGHVFLPRPKLLAATAQLLGDEDGVEEALDTLIDEGKVFSETVANVEACYLLRLHEAEDYACRKLTNLLSATADVSSRAGKTVDEIEAAQGITYAPLQRKAVELAAEHGVLILTGGPGTGKTTTVRGIVSLFERMGLAIVLAAPTGRAAQRLGELTGREAQTVHRLLGMSWNEATHEVTFTKGEKEPLEADAVIVDEMSMVDLPLFAALLRALRPGTRLVMVGDADQLPSVGPGNVFSDLIRSGKVETVFLREVFRQAERSAIIRNAHAVNAGEPPRLQNDQGDFYFLCRRDAQRAVSTVVELCKTRLPEKMGIPVSDIQVLTPTRKGPAGTENLNRLLQEALNPPKPGQPEVRWGDRVYRPGDRVMQTRNDYDILWEREDGTVGSGVFNGDVGHVQAIDPAGEWLAILYEDRKALYSLEMLSEIDLAYAQTVHKAQGSEYPCVVLCAMPSAPGLMVRGVLYTALTRARELLILVGDDAAVREMAANDRRARRYSGLRWRLAHFGEPN